MIEAVFQGQVVAHSDRSVSIDVNHHLPPADVDKQYLRRSRMKTVCPRNGLAPYSALAVGDVAVRESVTG